MINSVLRRILDIVSDATPPSINSAMNSPVSHADETAQLVPNETKGNSAQTTNN